ncbi:hypothetical protein MPTK1_2g06320 [Marchantia polymorpha subsp. ruderalis]|uniref:Uncharacterized protein n=2 Tax=Marchantia polymorpha TaxID=3197 RepID=A0A176W1Z2_MARPO|nr:hypothetical protein AXG93_4542s1440 [Marchantia polymorpha subsp. ruderalis]PTQ44229.1 hypothetical protein MARPO_0021s0087 [Marchantia polymorpha]BBN01304.1 hypothetical protein Mp_2g06320 [Marchantia polymorpha subsp. ruderalis]|eukprot:PTQ44229.1 hypothetical protein MARPO_0021s0087 [Marchantia polymorpha]
MLTWRAERDWTGVAEADRTDCAVQRGEGESARSQVEAVERRGLLTYLRPHACLRRCEIPVRAGQAGHAWESGNSKRMLVKASENVELSRDGVNLAQNPDIRSDADA